jgi:hypothetical protein
MNPKQQPCKTCKHFHPKIVLISAACCDSIEDNVEPWWRGCVRWKPNSILDGIKKERNAGCPPVKTPHDLTIWSKREEKP